MDKVYRHFGTSTGGGDGVLGLDEAQREARDAPSNESKEGFTYLTTNGRYEQIADKNGQVYAGDIQNRHNYDVDISNKLDTIDSNFDSIAGTDGKLSYEEAVKAKETTGNSDLKGALDWFTKKENWEKFAPDAPDNLTEPTPLPE
jgi:hypothetical protein